MPTVSGILLSSVISVSATTYSFHAVYWYGHHGDMEDTSAGFYENDEPVKKIRATFEAGIKGVTGRKTSGLAQQLIIPGLVVDPFVLTVSDEVTRVARRQLGQAAGRN